jgi:hypothetical protein
VTARIVIVGAISVLGGLTVWADTAETIHVARAGVAVMGRPELKSSVMATMTPDVSLDVLDRDGDWFWILLPADHNGTRRAGWVHASDVEGAVTTDPAAENHRDSTPPGKKRASRSERRLKRAKAQLDKAKRNYDKLTVANASAADDGASNDGQATDRSDLLTDRSDALPDRSETSTDR